MGCRNTVGASEAAGDVSFSFSNATSGDDSLDFEGTLSGDTITGTYGPYDDGQSGEWNYFRRLYRDLYSYKKLIVFL